MKISQSQGDMPIKSFKNFDLNQQNRISTIKNKNSKKIEFLDKILLLKDGNWALAGSVSSKNTTNKSSPGFKFNNET